MLLSVERTAHCGLAKTMWLDSTGLEISHGYFTDQVNIYAAFLVHWQNLHLIGEEIKLGQAACQCLVHLLF